jgi:hypothetical protein
MRAPAKDALPRQEGLLSVLLAVGALALYLAFRTAHHSYDAVAGGVLLYQWIVTGNPGPLFHEYHILYLPLAAVVESLLRPLGIAPDPLTLLQLINAVAASIAVALFYRLAREFGCDRILSLVLTGVLGLSTHFWFYATNGEPYAVSIVFLLLAFLSALRKRSGFSVAQLVLPGVWLGLATTVHITCILALPALMILKIGARRDAARQVVVGVVAAGLVAATPYVASFAIFHGKSLAAGLADELAASAQPHYSMPLWWSFDVRNLFWNWKGLVRSAVPPELLYAPSSFPAFARAVGVALAGITLVPWIALVARLRRPSRETLALAVWFATTFVFFCTYNVGSDKFATYQWAPLLLLTGVTITRLDPGRTATIVVRAAGAVVLAGVLVGSADVARKQADPETNPHLTRALALARHTSPRDLIVHLGRGGTEYQKVYTPYFALRPSLILDFHFDKNRRSADEAFALLSERLAAHTARGGRVVVLHDVFASADSREFERMHDLDPGALYDFFASENPLPLASARATGRLWLLREAPRASVDRATGTTVTAR